MVKVFYVTGIVIVLVSCSSSGSKTGLPPSPASVQVVQKEIKGKTYKVEKAGTHSVFSNDSSIQWFQPAKELEFEKKVMDEVMTLELNFITDTSVNVLVKGKKYDGTYEVNDGTGEDEKAGVKLRISYADEEFRFGDGPASRVTYTYRVEGIDEKRLLVETPRSVNNRKIVVLMRRT